MINWEIRFIQMKLPKEEIRKIYWEYEPNKITYQFNLKTKSNIKPLIWEHERKYIYDFMKK